MAPALTVYSRQPNFDPNLAPKEALLSLPKMNDRQVDQILSERLTNSSTINNLGATLPAGTIDPTLSLNGHAFAIKAKLIYRGTTITREDNRAHGRKRTSLSCALLALTEFHDAIWLSRLFIQLSPNIMPPIVSER